MKKLIITILVLAVIVGGYVYVSKSVRVSLSMLAGKKDKVVRGDLEVPITASGQICAASVTQIKGKASGEVVRTPFNVDEMVKQGDLIIRLDETDEKRNVQRATADFQRADVALQEMKLRRQEAEKVGVPLAQAKLDQAKARYELRRIAYNKYLELQGTGAATPQEIDERKASYDEADALVDAAEAELEQARIAIDMADWEIQAAEESQKAAKQALDDAKERLEETSVYSPIDGMVVSREVEIGEVVQSGKTSLTGGTVLIEIADVGEIYAEVNVDEADIGLVRKLATEYENRNGSPTASQPTTRLATLPEGTFDPTQRVEVTVEAYPEETFYGVIERISPQSEVLRAIATFKAWIRITSDNRNMLKRVLNTQAQANFTAKSVTNALLVSYEAMKPDPNGDGYGVYIPVDQPEETGEEYEFVPCRFGVDNRVQVEVIKGLEEGQEVYIELPKKTRKEKKEEEAED